MRKRSFNQSNSYKRMEVHLIKLNKIKVNDKNPRTITEDKLRRLIESILIFPKMLSIRPIVVDDKGVALGGNMRTRALKEIKKLGRDAIPERLQQIRQYANKPQEEKNELLAHWDAWFKDETVPVIHAESLTEEEKREFIIKDNSSFGAWDWDVLANEWESEQLDDWGVDVWEANSESNNDDKKDEIDLSDNVQFEFKLEIDCGSEETQQQLYDEFTKKGYPCRILTL